MSTFAWGALELDSAFSSQEIHVLTQLSFEITNIAVENRIGILVGGNAVFELPQEPSAKNGELQFRLLDDPMTNVAEILFSGDGVKITHSGLRVDTGERLDSRMSRVQKFLEEVMNLALVKKVNLHINSGFGEESIEEIKVGDFKTRIIDMFHKGDNWTPTVKFVISK